MEGVKPIKEGIDNLLQAIAFPAFPSIQAADKETATDKETVVAPYFIGDIAESYLRKFTTRSESDKTYGLYDRGGNFYIGNKPAVIKDINIIVDDKEYEGTPGLWKLILSKNLDENIYTNDDYGNYVRLMLRPNTLHRNNNPNSNYPESSKVRKWNRLLKPIWDNREEYEGSGVVVIPCDPNALSERLDLLLASKQAGHTGVENE